MCGKRASAQAGSVPRCFALRWNICLLERPSAPRHQLTHALPVGFQQPAPEDETRLPIPAALPPAIPTPNPATPRPLVFAAPLSGSVTEPTSVSVRFLKLATNSTPDLTALIAEIR
jgi:hypothetical protein